MAHFIQIGGLRDKCYVQIPDGIWSARSDLEQKQITEAVEKGFISDTAGGIGIKKSPRYHISIKSDYRLCTQLRAEFNSETFRSNVLTPFVSPYEGRTPATAGEQRRWFQEERTARSNYDSNVTDVVLKFLNFDREKNHSNLSTP